MWTKVNESSLNVHSCRPPKLTTSQQVTNLLAVGHGQTCDAPSLPPEVLSEVGSYARLVIFYFLLFGRQHWWALSLSFRLPLWPINTLSWNIYSDTSSIHPLTFTWGEKSAIWLRFSTQVSFESSAFRKGAMYLKSETNSLVDRRWLTCPCPHRICRSLVLPTLRQCGYDFTPMKKGLKNWKCVELLIVQGCIVRCCWNSVSWCNMGPGDRRIVHTLFLFNPW